MRFFTNSLFDCSGRVAVRKAAWISAVVDANDVHFLRKLLALCQNLTLTLSHTHLCILIHHKYRKHSNRYNLKMSFSSTPNIKNMITHRATQHKSECSCRNKDLCSPNETFMIEAVIYEATGNSTNSNNTDSSKRYMGLIEWNFKARFNNHNISLSHWNKRKKTTKLFGLYMVLKRISC